MNKCNFCGIEVLDKTEHCPLCNGVLEGDSEGKMTYPDLYMEVKKVNFLYRLLMFFCVLGGIGTAIGFYLFSDEMKWGVIVEICILYTMWMLYVSFNDRAGYRVRLLTGVAFAVLLVIAIDILIGYHGWSLNFILPSGIILVDVVLLVLMLANYRNWQSYLVFQIGLLLVCILPVIFIKMGLVTHPVVSAIAIFFTLIQTIGAIMLGGSTAHHELKRRFHVR